MKTIMEYLDAVRERMRIVTDDFIKSGKAIDFRLGEYVTKDDLTVGHYRDVLNGADGEERLWDIEDNCPNVYYNDCIDGSTVRHAFCVGVYCEYGRMVFLLYDMESADFVFMFPYDICEGRDYVLGMVEEFMSAHEGDEEKENVEQ